MVQAPFDSRSSSQVFARLSAWALRALWCAGLITSACGDPPAGSDASVSDALVPALDAPVSDAGGAIDVLPTPDGPGVVDGRSHDAALPDADIGEDATTGPGLSMLSDDFTGAGLDPSWKLFRDDALDIEVSAGALHLTPVVLQQWFNQMQGALVYKNASGNFKLTATVRSRRASDPSMPAVGTVEIGGLMARKSVPLGSGAQEDYVFVGVGSDGVGLVVETKSTNNGFSMYAGPAWSSGDAQLRVCRIGTQFWLYKRDVGATTWIEAASYSRPDMPATLQLAAMACANSSQPDLRASFDEIVFADAIDQADCTAD